jgi:multidrug resistance efflux pump
MKGVTERPVLVNESKPSVSLLSFPFCPFSLFLKLSLRTKLLRSAALLMLAFSLPVLTTSCRSSQTDNSQYGVVVVSAPAAGQVRRVLIGEGAEVREGTPIVEIAVERQEESAAAPSPGESADARAGRNLKAAEAAIEAARAEVVKHEAEVLRLTPLVSSGQAPQAQLDAARALYEQAQRRLQQAQDASRQAQGELLRARQPGAQTANSAPSTVPRVEMVMARATAAGTVAVISTRAGDRVTAGQPLATLRTNTR